MHLKRHIWCQYLLCRAPKCMVSRVKSKYGILIAYMRLHVQAIVIISLFSPFLTLFVAFSVSLVSWRGSLPFFLHCLSCFAFHWYPDVVHYHFQHTSNSCKGSRTWKGTSCANIYSASTYMHGFTSQKQMWDFDCLHGTLRTLLFLYSRWARVVCSIVTSDYGSLSYRLPTFDNKLQSWVLEGWIDHLNRTFGSWTDVDPALAWAAGRLFV